MLYGRATMTAVVDEKTKLVATPAELFPHTWLWMVWIAAANSVSALGPSVIPSVTAFVKRDLDLTDSQVGSLSVAQYLATFILSLVYSVLLRDRLYAPELTIIVSSVLTGVGTVIRSLAHGFNVLLVGSVVTGAMQTLILPAMIVLIRRRIPEHLFGMAFGSYALGQYSANVIVNAMCGQLEPLVGWRLTISLVVVCPLLLTFLIVCIPSAYPELCMLPGTCCQSRLTSEASAVEGHAGGDTVASAVHGLTKIPRAAPGLVLIYLFLALISITVSIYATFSELAGQEHHISAPVVATDILGGAGALAGALGFGIAAAVDLPAVKRHVPIPWYMVIAALVATPFGVIANIPTTSFAVYFISMAIFLSGGVWGFSLPFSAMAHMVPPNILPTCSFIGNAVIQAGMAVGSAFGGLADTLHREGETRRAPTPTLRHLASK